MILKNKKTGQLGNFIINKDHFECVDLEYVPEYRNLAELNEEWEDVEEPEGWCITMYGGISRITMDEMLIPDLKEIGNYFNDKESAYDALDKLKAWKRLKEKGFKFIGVRGIGKVIDFDMPKPYHHVAFDEYNANENELEFYNDLMLLFGGEE